MSLYRLATLTTLTVLSFTGAWAQEDTNPKYPVSGTETAYVKDFSSSKPASALVMANLSLPYASPVAAAALPEPITPAISTPRVPEKEKVSPRQKKIWYSLMAAEHSAAMFDAWSTRDAINRGAQELNPVMKPFASSGAIYPATQVIPAGMDYLAYKLMHSDRPLLRKLWWVPQTASTVVSFVAATHNMSVQPAR